MAKAVRSVRKYNAAELKKWMQLPLDVVRRTSMKDPRGELPIPFDHIRIIAMHHMKDRRNQPDCVCGSIGTCSSTHASPAAFPRCRRETFPVDALVERFKNGESPAGIAQALGLPSDAVASALAWAQKIAPANAAWKKTKIAQKAPPKTATLHGAALVEAAIASARKGKAQWPKPLPGALALGDVAAPKSLATWLAFTTDRVACATKDRLRPSTLRDVMRKLGYRHDQPALEATLSKPCYLLETGDTQATFLYAGIAEDGELPVLTIDVDGAPSAWISFPGFDVYVAARTGYLELSDGDPLPRPYLARIETHARHFGRALAG